MLVKMYFFIRTLINTNANSEIKRAIMAGEAWERRGKKKNCLVCKLTNVAEGFLSELS